MCWTEVLWITTRPTIATSFPRVTRLAFANQSELGDTIGFQEHSQTQASVRAKRRGIRG